MAAPSIRLRDVAQFVRGITFKPADVVLPHTPGSVACMRTKNVQATIDLSDVWAVPSHLVRRPDQFLRNGDVLVSSANSWNLVGKCCWVPELNGPSTFGGFISVLRARPDRIVPRYLYHWFNSQYTQETLRSFGQRTTSISNLNLERCLNLSVPLPSMEEQLQIATALDHVSTLSALRQVGLVRLPHLVDSLLEDLLQTAAGIQRGFLDDVAELRRGPFGGALRKDSFVPTGYKVYEQSNAINDNFETGNYFITEEKYKALQTFALSPGDLIVSCSGTLARVAIVPADAKPGVINQALLRVRPKTHVVTPIYLKLLLSSAGIQRQLTGAAHGSGIQNFPPMDVVRKLPVRIPSLEAQKDLSQRVAAVAKFQSMMAHSLDVFESMSLSLQQRSFRNVA